MKTRLITLMVLGVSLFLIGCVAQPPNQQVVSQPAQLPPPAQHGTTAGVDDIKALARAGMSDPVIIGQIQNSQIVYHLGAADIIDLKNAGVSENVIRVMIATSTRIQSAPPNAPSNASQPLPTASVEAVASPQSLPDAEVNFAYFHDQLAPFGTWIEVDGVKYWRPDSAIRANPDWRPYYDMGKWIQTDNGLFWQSDYTWGDIPFHYGRWVRHPSMGWIWAPDYEWGPAWVFWRHTEADAAIGWAPLPVGAVFADGAFMFHGARVGVDFDFGLGENAFIFMDYDHFHEPFFRSRGREYAWHVSEERFHGFYHRSVLRNEFRHDEHGRFVNEGIGRERMEHATRGRIEQARFEERNPIGDREKENARRTEEVRHAQQSAKAGGEAKGQKEIAAQPVSKVFRPPTPTQTKSATGTNTSTSKPSSSAAKSNVNKK